MTETDPDADLLARVARGDAAAMRELVSRKLPRLHALALRMLDRRGEAEEVTQEAFLRAWKQAADWRPGEARFDTWLHRVTLNLCYDRLRLRRDEQGDEGLDESEDPAAGPEQAMQVAQRGEAVAAAIRALPAKQREALVLQYYQDLSNQEAAQAMGISVEAVESLLARARRTLRARLNVAGKEWP